MRCDCCRIDKTCTVVRASRLCVACGGGDAPEQLVAVAERQRR